MSACLIVRAEVVDVGVKDDFDRWYQDEHLRDALRAFNARRAWRGWSDVNPNVLYAVYEFENVETARSIPGSEALAGLVAEFDRLWGERVVRTREVVDITQIIAD